MLDISSLVYLRLINSEQTKKYLKGSDVTKNDTPSAFPYLYMETSGEPTIGSFLQNKQYTIQAALEITIYDSTSSIKAKQLIFLAADLVQKMGFTMDYGPTEIDRANTAEAYCWIARSKRTYCEGDLTQQLHNL